MAAPSVSQMQAGLQARLDTVASLSGRTYSYYPDTISPPCAWVHFPNIPAYHQIMGTAWLDYEFPVYVAVARQVDRAGQAALEGYVSSSGADSVRAAVEADTSLGGLSAVAMVVDFRSFAIDEMNTLAAYGGVWTVRVTAQGA